MCNLINIHTYINPGAHLKVDETMEDRRSHKEMKSR